MSDETYNGWSNRETWAVALHINNDQGWQESVLEALREATLDTILYPESADVPLSIAAQAEDVKNLAISQAGDIIRDNVETTLEDLLDATTYVLTEHRREECKSLYTGIREDIGSLWRVNWSELGAALLADIAEG